MKKIRIDLSDPDFWADVDWSEPEQPEILKTVTDKIQNYRRANKAKAQDPEWVENVRQRKLQQLKDPGYLKKYRESMDKVYKDESWRARIKEINQNKKNDPEYLRKISEGRKGKKHSNESKTLMKEKAKGRGSIPLVTPNGIYVNLQEAAKCYDVDTATMQYWKNKSKTEDFFQISQEGFARLKLITDPVEFQKQLLIEKQVYIDSKKK